MAYRAGYDGLNNIGDTIVSKSFTSLTSNPNIPYAPFFWNEDTDCCYYRFKISKGDILTLGSAFSEKGKQKINSKFRNIVVGDVSGTYIHDYKFLNQKYKDEQVRVTEIYVTHEKYTGYKILYNKNEMPLYVSIYVKSANKEDNISSFFGDSKKTILNIETALEDMEIVNPNAPLSREEAIKKLRESKDLMELDMMSKEEYESLKKKLTPIIMQK